MKREALEQLRKNLEKNFFEGRKRPKSPIQLQDGRRKEEGGGGRNEEGGGRRRLSPDVKNNIFKINTVPNISSRIGERSKSNEREGGRKDVRWVGGGGGRAGGGAAAGTGVGEGAGGVGVGVGEGGGGGGRGREGGRGGGKEGGKIEEGGVREGVKRLAIDGTNLSKTGEIKLHEGESRLKVVSLKGFDNFFKMKDKDTSIFKNSRIVTFKNQTITPNITNISYPKIIKPDGLMEEKGGKEEGGREEVGRKREEVGRNREEGGGKRDEGGGKREEGKINEPKVKISYDDIVKDKLLICEQIPKKELSVIVESLNQASIDQVQEVERLAEWEKCVYEISKVNNILFVTSDFLLLNRIYNLKTKLFLLVRTT